MSAPPQEELINFLQHGTEHERCQAAHLLAGYLDIKVVTALSQTLFTSDNQTLQDITIKSLGRMGKLAFQALVRALGDGCLPGHPNQAVRAHAADALGKQQNKAAIEPLIQALKDVHPMVRLHAAGALIHYKEDKSIEALKYSLLHDPDQNVRNRISNVLQAMGITAPVNIPTIITTSKPISKPLPSSRRDEIGNKK